MLRIGLLCTLSALASFAQPSPRPAVTEPAKEAKPAVENPLQSAQKRFRPEIWSGRSESPSLISTRSCVYPGFETPSLVFRPCAPVHKIRLIPPAKTLPESPSK